MFLVDRATGESALATGEARPRHLRVRSDGQLLELPFGKVTIGSSPRCVLRIQKPGVEPVHCLIVHDAERLSVRRWAADTQLNGSPFEDAFLSAGDCLTLGSVELELIADEPAVELPTEVEPEVLPGPALSDDNGVVPEVPSDLVDQYRAVADLPPPVQPEVEPEPEPRHEAEPPLTFAEAAAATSIETVEFLFRELQSANGIARGRSRKLLAALRRERAGNEKLVKRLGEATVQLADLQRERADWEKSQWEAMQERRQWKEKFEALERQAKESEDRFSEQARRIAELERLVEEAQAHAVPIEVAPVSDAWSQLNELQVVESADDQADVMRDRPSYEDTDASAEGTSSESAEFKWPSTPDHKAAAWDEVSASATDDKSPEQVSASAELTVQPQGSVAQTWQGLASPGDDENDVFGVKTNLAGPTAEPSVWATATAKDDLAKADEDVSPFAEFSIWKQGAAEEPASIIESENEDTAEPETASPACEERSFGEAADANAASDALVATENPWAKPSAEVSREVDSPKPKAEPTSFIERYSHMFADDAAGASLKPVEPVKPLFADSLSSSPRGAVGLPQDSKPALPASSEDEESIEQYMAKLMLRVRGDSPAGSKPAASQAPPMPTPAPEVMAAAPEPAMAPAVAQSEKSETERGEEEQSAEEVAVNWEAIARRAAAAPKTNLGALRALANESARRAIGRHELKKLRRDAVTKVIVSTLAGMTSLWLMLEAPDWRDIQFITPCLALLMAAYWAGEALRAMLASMRLAAHEGPGADAAEPAAKSALPIDVDSSRNSA